MVGILPLSASDQPVTYYSDNQSVASVNGFGRINAASEGTATITATCADISSSFRLMVKNVEREEVAETEVREIDLGEYKTEMAEGEKNYCRLAFCLQAQWGYPFLFWIQFKFSRIEVNTDITKYEEYIGQNAKDKFVSKHSVDEAIFPKNITSDMNTLEYQMTYYAPWEEQFLSYLTVRYSEDRYKLEKERLQKMGIDEH